VSLASACSRRHAETASAVKGIDLSRWSPPNQRHRQRRHLRGKNL